MPLDEMIGLLEGCLLEDRASSYGELHHTEEDLSVHPTTPSETSSPQG